MLFKPITAKNIQKQKDSKKRQIAYKKYITIGFSKYSHRTIRLIIKIKTTTNDNNLLLGILVISICNKPPYMLGIILILVFFFNESIKVEIRNIKVLINSKFNSLCFHLFKSHIV